MPVHVRCFVLLVVLIAYPSLSAWASDAVPGSALAAIEWHHRAIDSMTIEYTDADADFLPQLERYLGNSLGQVQQFFAQEFPQSFVVRVFPSRAVMTEYWRNEWGVTDLETECWMVASGTASTLSLLSPRAWKTDACEHDAADTVRTQMLIIHEMVHTFHGQLNSRPEFEGLDSIGWFLEGLAVLASGQLEGSYLASAHEADSVGTVPSHLEDAWSGKYRYGVSGSLVAYIDATYSRKTILELLPAVSESEILNKLGTTEEKLLHDWRAWLVQ